MAKRVIRETYLWDIDKKWALYGRVLAWGIMVSFVAGALYSYDPEDGSLVHYTTREMVLVNNWCGIVGAHCAGIIWYLSGAAAYGVSIVLIGSMYMFIKSEDIGEKGDRLLAAGGLVGVIAGLCCAYEIDNYFTEAAGGVIGIYVMKLACGLCGQTGGIVCLHILLYSCLVVISRFFFMQKAQALIRVLGRGLATIGLYIFKKRYGFEYKQLIVQYGYCWVEKVYKSICRFVMQWCRYF